MQTYLEMQWISEAYLNLCQIFKMERFAKSVNDYAVDYICKTLHLRCFNAFLIHLQAMQRTVFIIFSIASKA